MTEGGSFRINDYCRQAKPVQGSSLGLEGKMKSFSNTLYGDADKPTCA